MRWSFCGSLATLCGIVAAAGLASSAQAIGVKLVEVTPRSTVSISNDGGAHFHNYTAGLDQFQGVPGNPLALRAGFTGFCIDFTQSISVGHTYTDYAITPVESAGLPPMGSVAANRIEELWGRHFNSLHTSTDYAAFQCSIWEILYDSGTSLSSGSFQMGSGSVRTLSQSWLGELNGVGTKATGLYALASATHQDMIVPTPGSAALVIGGMAVGLTRRPRRGISDVIA